MNPLDLVIEYPKAFPDDLCDEMIERFEVDDRKYKGCNGNHDAEHTTTKVSIDLMISNLPEWEDIDQRLFSILTPYITEYINLLREEYNLKEDENIQDLGYQIQKTEPGGYFSWHDDANIQVILDQKYSTGNANEAYCFRERVFTYILYLNDRYEYEDGQTEFKFGTGFSKVVRPERGKLILFPASPFYPHRGVPLENGVKYLMTGWVTKDMIRSVAYSPRDYQERLERYSSIPYMQLLDSWGTGT